MFIALRRLTYRRDSESDCMSVVEEGEELKQSTEDEIPIKDLKEFRRMQRQAVSNGDRLLIFKWEGRHRVAVIGVDVERKDKAPTWGDSWSVTKE